MQTIPSLYLSQFLVMNFSSRALLLFMIWKEDHIILTSCHLDDVTCSDAWIPQEYCVHDAASIRSRAVTKPKECKMLPIDVTPLTFFDDMDISSKVSIC